MNKREYTYKINDKRIKEDNSKKIEEPKAQYDISSYPRYKNYRRYGNENEKPKYETTKLRELYNGVNLKENEIEDLRKQINDLKNEIKEKENKKNKVNVKTKKKQ